MRYLVTQRIVCGLTIPNGKGLSVDEFTFLPDFEGEHQARHIQTTVETQTKEEAIIKASKLFNDFLATLTLLDDSRYVLNDNRISVTPLRRNSTSTTTHRVSISAGAFITQDGNRIKNLYEISIKGKSPRKKPIRLYKNAIDTSNPFEKFRNFYRVFECYGKTREITNWIRNQMSSVEMKKNNRGQNITIYTWIRIKLSHSKNTRRDLEPLLISNPKDVAIVRKYLPKMQRLAREKIKLKEGI